MKRTLLVQHLKKHGCHIRRHGAKHDIYENPLSKTTSTVPRHLDVNDFLAKKICKDLNISPF